MWRALLNAAVVVASVVYSHAQQPEPFDCTAAFKAGHVNVHVVPHTHDDPGWLKTVDQYYLGTANIYSRHSVQYILNTVVDELWKNKHRRFSYCEMSYFMRWWDEQDEATRHKVRQLVGEERLQFVGGGWVQSDEAASHYAAFIDQMSYGLRQIQRLFGERALPVAAWQIDPFGHSKNVADLLQRMGFKAVYFARLHYNDYQKRLNDKEIILNWQTCPADSCAEPGHILASHFYEYNYGPPPRLCWDQYCYDEPIQDDKRLDGYNLEEVIDYVMRYIERQSEHYRNDHIMFLMGNDFNYPNANKWYTNLDKMIKYVNQRRITANGTRVNMFYSTPNCYTRALQQEPPTKWGAPKTDDFFPYASKDHSYWTGYFTSRPTFKGYIRSSSNLLQHCTAAEALAAIANKPLVRGTAKQHTTDDYIKRLYEGQQECEGVLRGSLNRLSGGVLNYTLCPLANVSICHTSQAGSPFVVTVTNRLSRTLQDNIRIPFNASTGVVFGQFSHPNKAAITLSFPGVLNDQLSYAADRAPYELIIPVEVPPLGTMSYLVAPLPLSDGTTRVEDTISATPAKLVYDSELKEQQPEADTFFIENEQLKLNFNRECELTSMENKTSGEKIDISQEYRWYKSAGRLEPDWKQPSGAYVFRPNANETTYSANESGKFRCWLLKSDNNSILQEVRQLVGDYVSNTIRLWHNKPYAEVETRPGLRPRGVGHEVIMRFDSSVHNGATFGTDSNGRQHLNRQRDQQATYTYEDSEPAAGNYYPIANRIVLDNHTSHLTVGLITDRSHGATSLADGQFETMLHRRCYWDDDKGVFEPLNEEGPDGRGLVAKGRSWLLLTKNGDGEDARLIVDLSLSAFQQPQVLYAPHPSGSLTQALNDPITSSMIATKQSGTQYELPANVHLLTLERYDDRRTLLRLEHLFGKGQNAQLSQPAIVNLTKFFAGAVVKNCEEYALAADRRVNGPPDVLLNLSIVLLKPFQIRTIVCDISAETVK